MSGIAYDNRLLKNIIFLESFSKSHGLCGERLGMYFRCAQHHTTLHHTTPHTYILLLAVQTRTSLPRCTPLTLLSLPDQEGTKVWVHSYPLLLFPPLYVRGEWWHKLERTTMLLYVWTILSFSLISTSLAPHSRTHSHTLPLTIDLSLACNR